ncbi:MAG: hypothetical protein JWO15_753, partial [Sphingomonadales bacterium]|nr:hypothetical protein [Sphingomonadales bacterium]
QTPMPPEMGQADAHMGKGGARFINSLERQTHHG